MASRSAFLAAFAAALVGVGCAKHSPFAEPRVPVQSPSAPAASLRPQPPSVVPPRPASTVMPAAAASLREVVAALRDGAAAGKDPELAPDVDLLTAMEADLSTTSDDVRIDRVPDLEARTRAAAGSGSAFATVATYFAPGATPEAIRAAHLDYDRIGEWTGQRTTHVLSREGQDVLAVSDSMRKVLGLEFGARWRFRAHPFDRGAARLYVSRLSESEEHLHMRATKSVFVAIPEPGGTRVVEGSLSSLDYEFHPLLAPIAISTALKEMRLRFEGARAHWRDYTK